MQLKSLMESGALLVLACGEVKEVPEPVKLRDLRVFEG